MTETPFPLTLVTCARCPVLPFDDDPRFFVVRGPSPDPLCPSCRRAIGQRAASTPIASTRPRAPTATRRRRGSPALAGAEP